MSSQKRTQGFTLLELMIVVAIIGILATVAIPSFREQQWRSRRSEGFTNLAALAKSQRAYAAEFNRYAGAAPAPIDPIGPDAADWESGVTLGFASLGWKPEGDVRYRYDTNATDIDAGCCPGCFTSTAYSDIDGNGLVGALMVVSPSIADVTVPPATCTSTILAGTVLPPVQPTTLLPLYDAVATAGGAGKY